jgi:DNA-binding response OmpR family regulator
MSGGGRTKEQERLSPMERMLLDALVGKRGEVVTYDDLLRIDLGLTKEASRVYVSGIRPKIQGVIINVRGLGYRYERTAQAVNR